MRPLRHQHWRYLYQLGWLLIISAMVVVGAGAPLWLGLLAGGAAASLLVKRGACSFTCPLFAVGELLWRGGERLTGRVFTPPFWLDLLLRSAKYLLLGGALLSWHSGQLRAFFTEIDTAILLPVAALFVLSLFFQLPWCRYLCPYGALLGLLSLAASVRIRRSTRHCVRCHRCDYRCPANLPVMLGTAVRSPECFACYRCVDGCPAPGALALTFPGRRPVPARLAGILISTVLLAGLLLASLL